MHWPKSERLIWEELHRAHQGGGGKARQSTSIQKVNAGHVAILKVFH